MKKIVILLLIGIGVGISWYLGKSEQSVEIVHDKTDKSTVNNKPYKNKPKSETLSLPVNELHINDLVFKVLDKSIGFKQRTKDILALRKIKLTKADEKALLDHLVKVHDNEPHTITNDIIEHLTRYGSDKKKVGDALVKVLENPNQDKVVREYVLQYIPSFYKSRWLPGEMWSIDEDKDREILNNVLWNLTELTDGSMAGGALFALHRLSSSYEDIHSINVFEKSFDVLTDPSYLNPNRMAAMQILSFSKNEKYFELAKNMVYREDLPVLLRVTAIHTATQSQFKDNELFNYLRTISSDSSTVDPTLRRCAQLTIQKFKN